MKDNKTVTTIEIFFYEVYMACRVRRWEKFSVGDINLKY